MPARAGEHDARARRAYNGSSPSVIRKQARQNVYQSIERDAARAARRYRRKVGASGSPVLASSQSAAALAGLRRLEALRRLTEADPTPRNSELKHDEDALLATRQLLRYAPEPPQATALPARPAVQLLCFLLEGLEARATRRALEDLWGLLLRLRRVP